MSSEKPKDWHTWLPLAKWWYKTHFHLAIQLTTYEVVYGQSLPLHLPYLPGDSNVEVVNRSLQRKGDMISLLKFHLLELKQG